jgi:hypothetical protein
MARSHRTTNKRSTKHCVLVKSGRRQQDSRNLDFIYTLSLRSKRHLASPEIGHLLVNLKVPITYSEPDEYSPYPHNPLL